MVAYYTRLFEKTGAHLQVHFFEPSVLDKFRDDPSYSVDSTRFSTRNGCAIDSSGIQQYVWGYRANGSPCIAVLLPHLRGLSDRDQLHFQAHALSEADAEVARIYHRYAKPMIYGEFPDTISPFDAVFFYLVEVKKLFDPDILLPNLPAKMPDFLTPIPYNSKKAIAEFSQHLMSMMTFNMKTLAVHVTSSVRSDEIEKFLKHQQVRNLIRLYFEAHGQMSNEISQCLNVFERLTSLRTQSAHSLVSALNDDDYFKIQFDLVGELAAGLLAMLKAFAVSEKGTTETINKRVLAYLVD